MPKRFGLRTFLISYIAISVCVGLTMSTYLDYKKERPNFGKMFWLAKDVEITNQHYCSECVFSTQQYPSRHRVVPGYFVCKNRNEKFIIIWNGKPKNNKGREGVQASRRWYYPAKIWIFVKDALGIDLGKTK